MPHFVDEMPKQKAWGRWADLCASIPPGKTLEISDLEEVRENLYGFRTSWDSTMKRYGCIMHKRGNRLFLKRPA